ncbi:MAG: phytase [Phaeodactylibacter sp.]|nr:phytase [Phaeodactylibacter sp.]
MNRIIKTLLLFSVVLSSCDFIQGNRIPPDVVTEPVPYESDDPAIWRNNADPAQSIIFGTDKQRTGGLYAFGLDGRIISEKTVLGLRYPNNVDVEYDFRLGGDTVDIVVVTERDAMSLRIFSVPEMQPLDKGGIPVFEGERGFGYREPMGIGLYRAPSGEVYAIVSRKNGPLDGYLWQYHLKGTEEGMIQAELVRKFGRFSGFQEIEAIAVDDELGYVYYADEAAGIRKYYAGPEEGNEELAFFGKEGFLEDREGIAVLNAGQGKGFILVSDQQGYAFRVFPREGQPGQPHQHPFLKELLLSTWETDGCEGSSMSFGPAFPNGLFVAMSGDRTFHYYSLEKLGVAN